MAALFLGQHLDMLIVSLFFQGGIFFPVRFFCVFLNPDAHSNDI
jgi:hypothetical protein